VALQPEPRLDAPWFTGPLIAPSALTVPAGRFDIEPYLFAIAKTGNYDSSWKNQPMPTLWTFSSQNLVQWGINSWMDMQVTPGVFYNYTNGAAKWGVADLPVLVDFQLYRYDEDISKWITAFKLTLMETFPLGEYQNLSPAKKKTDAIGAGSYQTSIALTWGNMWYLGSKRFLTARFFLQYTLPAPVKVKNLNAYGGALGTKGTAYPPQQIQFDAGMEVSLSKNWAFAMDALTVWNGKTRFKGIATAPNTAPKSIQFSLAPALEYNWSANLGIIFGSWLTVAGSNSLRFTSGVVAINYYN
jgi:hypothetical protein